MNTDHLALALREITETKNLVESLLLSSESFDYAQAKIVLKSLQQKARELSKLQARLEKKLGTPAVRPANVCVLDFSRSGLPPAQPPQGTGSHDKPWQL